MNQQWQPPSRIPGATGGGGSVRRARERMAAGLPPAMPPPPPQGRVYEPPRMAAPVQPASRIRPPMPIASSGPKTGQAPIGVAISAPTQIPQWPLAGTAEPGQQYKPPAGRGPPPQRPPRPSQVPSILEISQLQDGVKTAQYAQRTQEQLDQQYERERREEEDMISPIITSPMSMSSRPSTLSSVGSIPDFPVPVAPGPPRRSANLGPPPSARRGASSYYSQASFVSPIPEESPGSRTTHLSYASSAAIPTSWGSNSPRYPYDDEYEDESVYDGNFNRSPTYEEGRESRGSADDNDDRGLIRSASFGRRAKPSMITTKSSERIEPRPAPVPQQKPIQMTKLEKMGILPMPGSEDAGATKTNGNGLERKESQRNTVWPIIGDSNSPLATGTGFIDKSTSSSEESVPTLARAFTTDDATPANAANFSDSNAKAMLGAYNAASSLQPPGTQPSRTPSPGNGFSRLSAVRRPPRLDMDAVRDAEARGSLTSLPDLIRRATRLAAMMDRGKRPGSRLALNDFPSQDDFAREKEMGMRSDEKHRSGFSGMLASFPPPGVQTPQGDTPTRPMSAWPTGFEEQPADGQDGQKQKKPRRCCGLPCWGFLLVVLILLIIIAAAVVVPLELLVLNKPDSSNAGAVTVAACQANSATVCQNGGTSVVDNGSCACICTNGFTGSTCTSANATGCATVTMSGSSFTNVTLGQSISRLISGGQTNFSIPLSESTILARFNSANLSCATENALVTFQGRAERVGAARNLVFSATSSAPVADPTAQKARRQDIPATTTTAPIAAATNNGIVYDASATNGPPSAISTLSTSSDPQAVFSITEEVLDFARVAVLYVLQEDDLENAITAQSSLQTWFKGQSYTNQAAMNVSLGHGNVVNLLAFQVDTGNGTVGSKNASLAYGKARREIERRAAHMRRSIPLFSTR
ncbi:hypothetical protein ONS95_001395 [Cadophora gregata]|uniref:uncharacterized protein n=1 Tax=Cadophora gregata TaxID=51156 RepID=UPI0026DAB663|nr:uncharacterized protein ONS95_001395 [Cadophora gregata]KAK0111015.1 hypothetical protein ONS95_001395 [Cadophora gregata]KAK0112528.1 hypothetical protein ONS96_001764 [Cadophora gregata f. sp. sojae]